MVQHSARARPQHILLVSHTARREAIEASVTVYHQLIEAGVVPVMSADERACVFAHTGEELNIALLHTDIGIDRIDSAIVLGGDGTILRAAELLRGASAPILGVNLGHVGFLAESEKHDLSQATTSLLSGEYQVEERITLQVDVSHDNELVYSTWALNEATVEKASRERMLEVVIEVDGRPLSSFGCDGVVMSTPTGSTAYSFSAGGPVVWPNVDALLMVPLSPHSLFNRPLVVDPSSSLVVEVLERNQGTGVLWCDGRRTWDLPQGARVTVTRSEIPVRLARIADAPFTDRLVNKFHLPVDGWRGPVRGD
ncbi:NAD kinase [Lysinibacter cavernae]|uniref:NAD kinase n=1 Tax=Lysinibacter cavernae TaxID=1640652 RepID=A0A7X5R0H6_9MICO|nr:NAD kinase [Lysinibacter cavernae]NIH53359.1 NAD+ kinase [Lysinibacter cavernae]